MALNVRGASGESQQLRRVHARRTSTVWAKSGEPATYPLKRLYPNWVICVDFAVSAASPLYPQYSPWKRTCRIGSVAKEQAGRTIWFIPKRKPAPTTGTRAAAAAIGTVPLLGRQDRYTSAYIWRAGDADLTLFGTNGFNQSERDVAGTLRVHLMSPRARRSDSMMCSSR